MRTDRREFLGTMLAAVPAVQAATPSAAAPKATWDTSWTGRLATRRHRAVFDSPEVSMGLALARTQVWFANYAEIYGTRKAAMGAIVVLRHNGIWLAMDDEFWSRFKVGALVRIDDPATKQPISRNPFLGANIIPEMPSAVMDRVLLNTIQDAVAVLACNLAFQDVVDRVKQEAGLGEAPARALALEHLVKGIILQPSGVFAVTRAQEAGCQYIVAS